MYNKHILHVYVPTGHYLYLLKSSTYTSRMRRIVGRAWASSARHERKKSSSGMKGKRARLLLLHLYDLCNLGRWRICMWHVFETGWGYSAVVLDHSQAPPSSPSLFCTRMLGRAWKWGYSSLVRLPQQLHEQHALLSLLSWTYSACVLFALLFQQCRVLPHSILRFFFGLLRCLRGPSWVTSRTRLCHINNTRSFTSRTSIFVWNWSTSYWEIWASVTYKF